MLINSVFDIGFTSLFSLIYISQIAKYAPSLVVASVIIILLTFVFTVCTAIYHSYEVKKEIKAINEESGLSYAMISGVQKIKLAGAEKRAYSKWSNSYAKVVKTHYNPPLFLNANRAFASIISLIGVIVIYAIAVNSNVSVADYYSFNTAYSMVSGSFVALSGVAATFAKIKPVYNNVKPILDAVPEIANDKVVIEKLSGGIELSNLSFRYNENMPYVINNLSLKIRPGQYVAIVGKTGCGKSTLMRLLLGFETPDKGAIYYDGKDLQSVDQKSLRKKIGVVMQEGKLFAGDIYSNIVISKPNLPMESAWEAAEIAGIADDIKKMPMGMFTMISEGSGGVSGGQRQRLMIARAVAPKPKILMFDEATSALDNITQKQVANALAGLKCTRIVIAHRLSTIKECDKIILLDEGVISEEGTYDELIAKKGKFFELVERQRLDN